VPPGIDPCASDAITSLSSKQVETAVVSGDMAVCTQENRSGAATGG
jgi:hypothetical protein